MQVLEKRGRFIDPRLRKVFFMSHNCKTVKFLSVLEPFFDFEGPLTSSRILEIVERNNIEFNNIYTFRMFLKRLVDSNILVREGFNKYSLNLSLEEREILQLLRELCRGGQGEDW